MKKIIFLFILAAFLFANSSQCASLFKAFKLHEDAIYYECVDHTNRLFTVLKASEGASPEDKEAIRETVLRTLPYDMADDIEEHFKKHGMDVVEFLHAYCPANFHLHKDRKSYRTICSVELLSQIRTLSEHQTTLFDNGSTNAAGLCRKFAKGLATQILGETE